MTTTDLAPAPVRRRSRPVVIVLGAIILAIAAMWVYIFAFAAQTSPDRVHDHGWTARAKGICSSYQTQIAALPPAASFLKVQPAAEAVRRRAEVGDQVTTLLRAMVAELRSGPAPDDASTPTITAWLHDYDTYLADRDHHIAQFRAGVDTQFAETKGIGGEPGSLRMDQFARVNLMASCQVPQDLG